MLPSDTDHGTPDLIYVISGKRKSGKDYVANLLVERFGDDNSVIIRLSGPLKERYALENNLDYEKLLDSSDYKETFRQKMIKWGEDIRNKDPGYFCRHAIQKADTESKRVWIVSDARRKTDVQFFLENFPSATFTVRINASESVRKQRGWKFTPGVDDCESECGLDDYSDWDYRLMNDDLAQLSTGLDQLLASSTFILSNINPMDLL